MGNIYSSLLSNATTITVDSTGYSNGTTAYVDFGQYQQGILGIAPAPCVAQPKKSDNEQWLDKRIADVRVAL